MTLKFGDSWSNFDESCAMFRGFTKRRIEVGVMATNEELAAGDLWGKSTGWLRHKVSSWPMKLWGSDRRSLGFRKINGLNLSADVQPRSLWNRWSKGRKAGRAQEWSYHRHLPPAFWKAHLHRQIDACGSSRHPQLQSLPEQEGPRSAGKCKSLPLQNKIDQLVCSLVRLGIHCHIVRFSFMGGQQPPTTEGIYFIYMP